MHAPMQACAQEEGVIDHLLLLFFTLDFRLCILLSFIEPKKEQEVIFVAIQIQDNQKYFVHALCSFIQTVGLHYKPW